MERIKDCIERFIAGDFTQEYLEQTEWLEQLPPAEIENLYRLFAAKHETTQKKISAILGEPEKILPKHADWFGSWYPEAFAAALWRIHGKWLCLAAEHHDRETPIALLIRSVTDKEIAELSEGANQEMSFIRE